MSIRVVPGSDRTASITYEVTLAEDPESKRLFNETHIFDELEEALDFAAANEGSDITKCIAYHNQGDRFRGYWWPEEAT